MYKAVQITNKHRKKMLILTSHQLQVNNKFNSSLDNQISSFKWENGKGEKHSEQVQGVI